MAQVPYQPFSTATPLVTGEKLSVATPESAFGVNVGQALEHLGTTGQEVGREMFARAQAMQDLKNKTDAMNQGIDFAVASGKNESDFKALPDGEKANALPGYLKSQQELMERYRSKLTNAQAQDHFNSDAAPFLKRIIFAASAISGDAQQKFELQTLEKKMDLDIKQTEDYPKDAAGIAAREKQLTQDAQEVAHRKWSHDIPDDHPLVADEVAHVLNKNGISQVNGYLKAGDIEGARAALEANPKILPDDRAKLTQQIEYKSNGIIASNESNAVLRKHRKDDGTYDASTREMVDEVKSNVAGKYKNQALPVIAARNLETQLDIDRRADRIDFQETRNALHAMVLKFGVQNRDQLLAVPGGMALVAKLPEAERRGLDGSIFRWRNQANAITRPETLQYIKSLKNNDVEAYLNITDFSQFKDLNVQDVTRIQEDQVKTAKNPQYGNDPRVNRAMGILKGTFAPQMNDLKLMNRTSDKKQQQGYDSMTAMLQTALDVWPEQHNGKPPTDTDVKETIGPQVIQHYTESTWHGLWKGAEHPAYQGFRRPTPEEVPEEFKQDQIRRMGEAGLGKPTPHQIYKSYLDMIFQKTLSEYKKGADAKPKP